MLLSFVLVVTPGSAAMYFILRFIKANQNISMARTDNPDSATAQFFISVADNSRSLDPRPGSAGYAVFGKVIDGMHVVDAIVAVPTGC